MNPAIDPVMNPKKLRAAGRRSKVRQKTQRNHLSIPFRNKDAFAATSVNRADARQLLASVAGVLNAPNVAHANALVELAPYVSPANADLARRGLADSDPMVRIAAIDMLANVPAAQAWPLIAPLLSDSVLGVRIRAASLLAAVPTGRQPQADRERFERAAAEFVAAVRLNADRPEDRCRWQISMPDAVSPGRRRLSIRRPSG